MTDRPGLVRIRWLGRLEYDEAWDLSRALWEGRTTGRTAADRLLLLEHPHVYTVGRNGDGSNLLAGADRLAAIGATVEFVDPRWRHHLPRTGPAGRLPDLRRAPVGDGFDMVGHVRRLEQVLLATLARFGIAAWTEAGYTGVWTARGKVAAIGVRVSRGVSMHGFALNVDPDLSYFGHIVPCGIADRPVTSMTELLGRPVALEEVVRAMVDEVAPVYGHDSVETQLGAFARGTHRAPYDIDRLVAEGVFSPERRREEPLVIGRRLAGEPGGPRDAGEGRRHLRGLSRPEAADARPGVEHGVRGGRLSQHLRVLGPGHRHPDAARRPLHPRLLLLRRGHRAARRGRPRRARRAAEAVEKMGLRHAVLTSVNRDDLPDGGSSIFAETIERIRRPAPRVFGRGAHPRLQG